jgi:AcrR family transcriptional regulator
VAKGAPSRISQRRLAARAEGGADYNARRRELIRTAADVFRAKGYSGSTLHDIADALGTDRASLYYYVASKEELFQACISEAVTANIARASEIAAAGLTSRERLVQLIELLINSQVEHQALSASVATDASTRPACNLMVRTAASIGVMAHRHPLAELLGVPQQV